MTPRSPRFSAPVRIALVVGMFVALLGLGFVLGAFDDVSSQIDRTRALVDHAGASAPVLFVGIFALGELMHIPGMVFIFAGVLAFGKLWGFVLGFLGSVISVCVTFGVVRRVGGSALGEIENAHVKRVLAHVRKRPVLVVIGLRTVLWISPPLSYALALSPIRFRDYLLGSAVGLLAPVLGASLAFEWIVQRFLSG